jgi:hypothetical protein
MLAFPPRCGQHPRGERRARAAVGPARGPRDRRRSAGRGRERQRDAGGIQAGGDDRGGRAGERDRVRAAEREPGEPAERLLARDLQTPRGDVVDLREDV